MAGEDGGNERGKSEAKLQWALGTGREPWPASPFPRVVFSKQPGDLNVSLGVVFALRVQLSGVRGGLRATAWSLACRAASARAVGPGCGA
jgi:hypothetical protein